MENSPSNSCSSTSSKSRPSPPRGHEIWPPTETMHHVFKQSTIEMGTFSNSCHKVSLYLIYIYILSQKLFDFVYFLEVLVFWIYLFRNLPSSLGKSSALSHCVKMILLMGQKSCKPVEGTVVYPFIPLFFTNGFLYIPRGFLAGVRKTIKQ